MLGREPRSDDDTTDSDPDHTPNLPHVPFRGVGVAQRWSDFFPQVRDLISADGFTRSDAVNPADRTP
jgi:hypothetical protein